MFSSERTPRSGGGILETKEQIKWLAEGDNNVKTFHSVRAKMILNLQAKGDFWFLDI